MCSLPTHYQLAELGSLLAEPARAAILLALADGSARPAGELARLSGIAPSTASGHLRRLLEGGLLSTLTQGRHRYFRIADEAVIRVLEALPLIRPSRQREPRRASEPLHIARTCYRHLAGRLGVAFYACMRRRAWIDIGADNVHLNRQGTDALRAAGLLPEHAEPGTPVGHHCLDWTERRYHLGGALGVTITEHLLQRDWLRRQRGSRALLLTPPGRTKLLALGVDLDD